MSTRARERASASRTKSLEQRLLSRYRRLNPVCIRITTYPGGTTSTEVGIPSNGTEPVEFISTESAELRNTAAISFEIENRRQRRIPVRLNRSASYAELSDSDKAIIDLSNKKFEQLSLRLEGETPAPRNEDRNGRESA